MQPSRPRLIWGLVLLAPLGAGEPPAAIVDAVRPVLEARCVSCHDARRQKGGLDLSTREGLLKGGKTGPAVDLDAPDGSLLLDLVTHRAEPAMPQKQPKLADAEIGLLTAWVKAGAPYDRPLTARGKNSEGEGKDFWAFQPLARPAVPAVRDGAWPATPVDRFILAALEANGLAPAPPADRRTLIRRVRYDLTGLPPTPAEVREFEDDPDPAAYERLVDRLLADPAFGERWARHWLDVARYADSNGYEGDEDRPGAYAYRDFVISALNEDMPFDRFVRLQLAGDELAPDDPRALAATGFLTAGPHLETKNGTPAERELYRYDELDDMLQATGSAFLGLTIGCARCHDHKYDPIPTRDYYRMLAAFTGTKREERTLAPPVSVPNALVLAESQPTPVESYLLHRGDPAHKQEPVTVGFLGVLPGAEPEIVRPPGARTPHQRAALARWLTDVDRGAGALTARVIVNRLWQHHFGEGLVRTPNDFGFQGERPTHPELLDLLAGELVAGGWRLKPIHRLILRSACYRRATAADPEKTKADPDNRLLGRRRPLRLEAEALRDAILAVSGGLDPRMAGPAVKPAIPSGALAGRNKDDKVKRPESDGPEQWRRSVYLFVKRSIPTPLLETLDAPNASGSCGRRPVSTVAPQALALLNDRFVRGQAARFATRVAASSATPVDRVRFAFTLALGRDPTPGELERSASFLARGDSALVDFCQVLLGLNEFAYVD